MRTVDVIGTRIHATELEELVDALESVVDGRAREYVCFANAHVTATARRNPQLANALAEAGFVVADGAPVAWAAGTPRIAGSDVFAELCRRSVARRDRHFFLGATDETLARIRARVEVEVCGTYAPPFGAALYEQLPEIAEGVNAAAPDVVWVGLGAPRQELFMQAIRTLVDAPLLLGVGAVFDFAAGTKARAPGWMQRSGLEWLHRLACEPRRLARRYLVTNTRFALLLAAGRISGR